MQLQWTNLIMLLCFYWFYFCRGDPIPSKLIEKVDEYIPNDLTVFFDKLEVSLYLFIALKSGFSYPSLLDSCFQNYFWIYMLQCLYIFSFIVKNETEVSKFCTWIHSDVMDDNIYMIPRCSDSLPEKNTSDPCLKESTHYRRSNNSNIPEHSWEPSHILDFSDLSLGKFTVSSLPDFEIFVVLRKMLDAQVLELFSHAFF